MVTKSFLFHFIQQENGWGSLVYILGLVIAIPIYLQSSESSLGQLWLATVCWEIQFHNWLVLVVNYQLRSMSFPSPFVFNTDTNALTMLLTNPRRYIKVFLQGRTWWVFETLATLKTRAFFQANAHFLQALLFMKFCGPLDNWDPCRGENLALSLVHVDHYIERAKEEDNLLAAYRWLTFKSLMSKVFGKMCFVFHLIWSDVAFPWLAGKLARDFQAMQPLSVGVKVK